MTEPRILTPEEVDDLDEREWPDGWVGIGTALIDSIRAAWAERDEWKQKYIKIWNGAALLGSAGAYIDAGERLWERAKRAEAERDYWRVAHKTLATDHDRRRTQRDSARRWSKAWKQAATEYRIGWWALHRRAVVAEAENAKLRAVVEAARGLLPTLANLRDTRGRYPESNHVEAIADECEAEAVLAAALAALDGESKS